VTKRPLLSISKLLLSNSIYQQSYQKLLILEPIEQAI